MSRAQCDDCGLVPLPNSGPDDRLRANLEVLRRLPESLFNVDPPIGEEGTGGFDVGKWDHARFDQLDGGEDGTPQYQIAKAFAMERDRFIQSWLQAEANQLGLGRTHIVAGVELTEGIHAQGADLDRLLGSWGIGRPHGFTDCCYFRLWVLLLFTTQKTPWLLRELGELYTGTRPDINVTAAGSADLLKVILTWPAAMQVMTFVGGPGGVGVSYLVGDLPTRPSAFDPYVAGNATHAGDTFIGASAIVGGGGGSGLTLEQAIGLVKAAGVAVELRNRPRAGMTGCDGATLHGNPNLEVLTDAGLIEVPLRGYLPPVGEVLG